MAWGDSKAPNHARLADLVTNESYRVYVWLLSQWGMWLYRQIMGKTDDGRSLDLKRGILLYEVVYGPSVTSSTTS